jgi:tellurite resistance-related uncharacterized protein
MPIQPYRATPVFTEATLPAGLRAEHRLKAGVRITSDGGST